jgi:hypothetical protein
MKIMSIFKESQIKKMLGQVQSEQITLSRMVEFLNQEAYNYKAKKGDLVSMMDIITMLECFLSHNPTAKSMTQVKVKTLIDYMKSEVIAAHR